MPAVLLMRPGGALRRASLPSPSRWESTHVPLSTPRELCFRFFWRNRREKCRENLIYTDGQKQGQGDCIHTQTCAASASEASTLLPPNSCQEALGWQQAAPAIPLLPPQGWLWFFSAFKALSVSKVNPFCILHLFSLHLSPALWEKHENWVSSAKRGNREPMIAITALELMMCTDSR